MPQAIQLLLSVLAGIARDRDDDHLADYLDLAGQLVLRGDAAREEFEALTAEIQALVDAGEDPTPEQREAVRARRRQLSEELQGLGREDDGGD